MSAKPLFALCLMVAVSAYAQNPSDLAARYSSVSAYEVRPGILMTANYTESGQVCEMVLEKRHETSTKTDLSSTIPRELVEELIDELVPLEERGRPSRRYFKGSSESTISGGVEERESDFENVSIKVIGSISESCDSGDEVIIIRWKKRTCEAPKPAAVETTKESR